MARRRDGRDPNLLKQCATVMGRRTQEGASAHYASRAGPVLVSQALRLVPRGVRWLSPIDILAARVLEGYTRKESAVGTSNLIYVLVVIILVLIALLLLSQLL